VQQLISLFPRRSVKNFDPSMHLDLKLDQTTLAQHSVDSSESDNDEMIKKRVKPKKSHSKPNDISLHLEDEIENSPVVSDFDSDNGDLVMRRKRAKMSKRRTINQQEINVRLILND
jgi:hypothetical protein